MGAKREDKTRQDGDDDDDADDDDGDDDGGDDDDDDVAVLQLYVCTGRNQLKEKVSIE